mgnify:CR=1 FL=1
MGRDLMLVAGSGRSGTSLFASIVGNLGFYVPRPQVQSDDTNPRGFGEPQWVVDKHSELLRQANVQASDARPSAWADTAKLCLDERAGNEIRTWLEEQFTGHDQVVIKDPRLLWFLPLWSRAGEELGADVSVVTMLRHPAEVVRSKSYWYSNMPLTESNRLAGWVNTMLFTERATRGHRRIFVRFEDLLEDWTQQVARVSAQLDIPSLVNARARQQAAADSLVDRSLHRSKAGWGDLDVPGELMHLAERVWEELLKLSEDALYGDSGDHLDRLREEYISYYRYAEQVAQSSILAENRKFRRSRRSSTSARPSVRPADPMILKVRRFVPPEIRDRIPLRVKRAVAELLR